MCDAMARALPFPDAPHEEFVAPPVKVMLGQVRFPTILRIANLSELADFHEDIREEYPEFAQEQQINLTVGPQGLSAGEDTRNYRFSTADGAWSVVLNPSFLSLEAAQATKYSNYGDFRDRFVFVWQAAQQHLGPSKIAQQGLRYVDHFDWPDVANDQWRRYVNESLLGVLGIDGVSNRVQHTLTDCRLDLGDGIVLSFKYGLVRMGPENAIGFTMDTDCFTQPATDDVAVDSVMSRFDRFHEEIHVLFNWATTDDARERFRGGDS